MEQGKNVTLEDNKMERLCLERKAGKRFGRERSTSVENGEKRSQLLILRGEVALAVAVLMNSFGVVLMLYSGGGISAISSVPYAFSQVFPWLSLGTWTYMFQTLLVLSLMILRKKFVPQYLFSFAVGVIFGKMLDFYELWIQILPQELPWRMVYFAVSFFVISVGIALSNRCGLPIIPTDLFPRELTEITKAPYSAIKITFDVSCLFVTAGLTGIFLGYIDGLGMGTVLAALTMGKAVAVIGGWIDRKIKFESVMAK